MLTQDKRQLGELAALLNMFYIIPEFLTQNKLAAEL